MSLPSRERGLKPEVAAALVNVETSLPSRERGLKHADITCIRLARMSLPSRERGLKHQPPPNPLRQCHVAPFTGAWIETTSHTAKLYRCTVAPFTGAWIETQTLYQGQRVYLSVSLPSRERGLKLLLLVALALFRLVAPFTGAWIETSQSSQSSSSAPVAPFTGAWIETSARRRRWWW